MIVFTKIDGIERLEGPRRFQKPPGGLWEKIGASFISTRLNGAEPWQEIGRIQLAAMQYLNSAQ